MNATIPEPFVSRVTFTVPVPEMPPVSCNVLGPAWLMVNVELGIAPRVPAQVARKPLAIRSTTLPKGVQGRSYTAVLKATGGTTPYRWSRIGGALPPGVRLASTGRLTGVPARSGAFTLRARVVDRGGVSRTRVVTVRIA